MTTNLRRGTIGFTPMHSGGNVISELLILDHKNNPVIHESYGPRTEIVNKFPSVVCVMRIAKTISTRNSLK